MPHRVRFADFGATVDALDRPATAPDAVTLGHAYKIPGRGWYVRVADREHTDPGLTKREAKALLRQWAERTLSQQGHPQTIP